MELVKTNLNNNVYVRVGVQFIDRYKELHPYQEHYPNPGDIVKIQIHRLFSEYGNLFGIYQSMSPIFSELMIDTKGIVCLTVLLTQEYTIWDGW